MDSDRSRRGTNARAAARLTWSLWAVAVALVAGGLVLGLANRPEAPFYEFLPEATTNGLAFATLGALIASRRPGNVIGWIFLVAGIASGIQMFSGQYATVALSGARQLPAGAVAAWLSSLVQVLSVAAFLFLVLLFPTGGLLSPRWRVVAWTSGFVIAFSLVYLTLRPGSNPDFASVQNPFGIEAAAAILDFLGVIGLWTGLACGVAAIVSLILRLHRSRGEERLQLKWFVYAATLGFLAILLDSQLGSERGSVGTYVWTLAFVSLPISAAIAILRYRLYGIDVIINRTLVYGALSAALALVYLGGVVGLQYVFRALTGGESQLAVVASTLAIAALFYPLRRRVQDFVDRRFYRRKYDAKKTLEAFSARLRDETDLDTLSEDLVSVVRDTMQPAHVSLWLRPVERSSEERGA